MNIFFLNRRILGFFRENERYQYERCTFIFSNYTFFVTCMYVSLCSCLSVFTRIKMHLCVLLFVVHLSKYSEMLNLMVFICAVSICDSYSEFVWLLEFQDQEVLWYQHFVVKNLKKIRRNFSRLNWLNFFNWKYWYFILKITGSVRTVIFKLLNIKNKFYLQAMQMKQWN